MSDESCCEKAVRDAFDWIYVHAPDPWTMTRQELLRQYRSFQVEEHISARVENEREAIRQAHHLAREKITGTNLRYFRKR